MPMMLECHRGIGPDAEGLALVADDDFSARYDLDRKAGVFSRPAHKLCGQNYANKVLVLNTAKGGVASAWMLHEMKASGIVPAAFLFNRVNPILAQGAALAELPMVDRFAQDITKIVRSGDHVHVMPSLGRVVITNRDA